MPAGTKSTALYLVIFLIAWGILWGILVLALPDAIHPFLKFMGALIIANPITQWIYNRLPRTPRK